MAGVAEPVASGFVAGLNQPGGNITGFGLLEASLVGKQLELLSEIAPGIKRAAIMFNPDTAPVSVYMPTFEAAARSLKVVPIVAPVHDDVLGLSAIALARTRLPRLIWVPAGVMTWPSPTTQEPSGCGPVW
jgi:putative ABC transport system substrate-binding protein